MIRFDYEGNFTFNDKDVVAITESVVARCEHNYVNMDDICYDIKKKYKTNHIGLVLPTPVSRNRFSLILKGIARAMDKITMLLSYPDDEVGNCLFDPNLIYENKLNPFSDVLNEKEYRFYFKDAAHIFTGVDYIKYFIVIIITVMLLRLFKTYVGICGVFAIILYGFMSVLIFAGIVFLVFRRTREYNECIAIFKIQFLLI